MSFAILFHFLCAQHVSDINISIIRSLRLFRWITTLVVLFLVRFVLEFRCGWFGVVPVWQAEAVLHPATRVPPQHSHTETPAHIETRTHNQCGDTIETSQAPDDGCPKHVEHRRSEIKLSELWHQVGLLFFNYHNDARSNKHKNLKNFEVALSNIFAISRSREGMA